MFGYSEDTVNTILNTVRDAKNEIIALLREQNAALARECERQRQRADLAVDVLLAAKHQPSIMPEKHHLPSPEERAEAAQRAREMDLVRSELEHVGDTGDENPEPAAPVVEELG